MNMKKRLLSALTLVALVLQLLGCLPAAAATTTTTTTESPEIPKFLILGNSFARDAMDEFHNVLKAEGVKEFTIGYLFHEACTLAMHTKYAQSGEKQYSYRKVTHNDAKWDKPDGYPNTMLDGLLDEDWDYVFLQGAVIDVADRETYQDLDFLLEYIKEHVKNPDVKFGWHMTWTFAGSFYEQRPTWGAYFQKEFQRNSQRVFKSITEAVQAEVLSRPFSIVIPSGTAIENVRASHMGDILQRPDGYHLNQFGKMVAAYCWYSALTGKTVESIKHIPSSLPTGLTLSEKDKAMIVEAVNSAVANPYSITVPTRDDSAVLYSKTSDELYEINPSEERQIITYWGPNTEDVALTTNKVRKDIAFMLWTGVTGPQVNADSNYLVQFTTKPHYDSAGEFSYGLRNEEDGTPNTLSLTLKEGVALDTTKYGEIELTFQYVRRDLVVPTIDTIESGFRVQVSTDGGVNWKDGYAGMKSHRIIAEGHLLSATGNVAKCYEIKSTDLSVLAEGEPINAVRILPFGDFDDFTAENTFVRAISITGHEGTEPAKKNVMVPVKDGILRQIVAAHAKRLNSDQWTPTEDIEAVKGSAGYDEETGTLIKQTRTYKAGRTYYGPVYAKTNAATYERFRADIDENGVYIGATGDEYGDSGINGMDCITVVYDCLSQITTSRSASNWYYTFYDLYHETENPNGKVIPLYQAAERGSIDRNSSNEHFASLVAQEGGQEAMYALYDELKPGDFLLNEDHIRVITSPTQNQTVYVGETAGTIEHHYIDKNGEQLTTTAVDTDAFEAKYSAYELEYQWGSSMRYDRALKYTTGATKSIYDAKYLPYTLAEYEDKGMDRGKDGEIDEWGWNWVEKEKVLITTNSNDPADFITNGFCAAIDSNYIIRTLTVTLTDKSTQTSLYSKSVYGVQSDYSYLFADEALNTALANLEDDGRYELKVEVLSGPRVYMEDGSVISKADYASQTVNPTTTFTYDINTYPQYDQTVGEVENGTVTLHKTSGQTGDTVAVSAVPAPGYELEAICVDGNPIAGNIFTISGKHEVTATFVKATYTVTVTAAEHGAVTVDKYSGGYGDIVTATAVPAEHYKLKQFFVNGYAIEGNTFPITRNQIVTAEFEPITYTISVDDAQNGTVTVDKTSGIYGETVTVTAYPDDDKYVVGTILVNGKAIPGKTFTITGNHTVSAQFELDATDYAITVVQPDNGTVTADKTSGRRGETVTVTATPDEGYKLWAVLVDGAAIQGSTFTIRDNHTVTALFVPETFELGDDETLPMVIPGPQKEEPEPEEPFSLYNANMELGNSLTMYFYFKQADIDPAEDYYVTITKTYADGRADVVKTIPEKDWIATTDEDVPVYRVGFDGIAAKEMADDLKVQVFTADGAPASNLLTYSIRTYAMTMLHHYPTGELATLFVDMLNYGAAAQTFFEYNTEDLANAQLTEEQQALATQSVEPVNNRVVGDMYYNVSLQLESEILLQMYFEGVTSDLYAKVTFTDHYGTQKSAVVPFEKFHHVSGTVYYIDVEGLAVADGRQLVTCELYNANDELVGSGTDSIESYIATMNSVAPDALYTQIMKFVDSAYRYFH